MFRNSLAYCRVSYSPSVSKPAWDSAKSLLPLSTTSIHSAQRISPLFGWLRVLAGGVVCFFGSSLPFSPARLLLCYLKVIATTITTHRTSTETEPFACFLFSISGLIFEAAFLSTLTRVSPVLRRLNPLSAPSNKERRHIHTHLHSTLPHTSRRQSSCFAVSTVRDTQKRAATMF